MHAWIKLKLGTQNGHIKENLYINFGVNLIEISVCKTIDLLARWSTSRNELKLGMWVE